MIHQFHEVGEVMTFLDVASRLDLELYATSSGTVIPHCDPGGVRHGAQGQV